MAITPNDGYVRVLSTLKSANPSFFVVDATDIGYYEYVDENGVPQGDLINLQQKIQSLILTNDQMEETKSELLNEIDNTNKAVETLTTTVETNNKETNNSILSINNSISNINTKIDENYNTLNSAITYTDGRFDVHIGTHIGRKGQNGFSSEIFNDYERNSANGKYSHAEGAGTTASGNYSHSEGYFTDATSSSAHSEGSHTTASGGSSHAEGTYTSATAHDSHAENYKTIASGVGSHAEGRSTIAASKYQHVQGIGNIEDSDGVYAHIVGNGTISENETLETRSNAHTLDWDGNAWFAGDVTIGDKELSLKETINRLNRLKYYGDENIYPTDESLFEFTLNDDESGYDIAGNYFIADNSNITDIVIPYEYNGKPILSITGINHCYESRETTNYINNSIVKSMIVPSTITEIPKDAFNTNNKLRKLILPDSITHIHNNAFLGCIISDFKFPKNLEYIGTGVLSGISDTEIYIPETVTYIGDIITQGAILVVEKDSYADSLIYAHNHSSQFDSPLEVEDGYPFKYTKDFSTEYILNSNSWFEAENGRYAYNLGTDGGSSRYMVYPSVTMDISIGLDGSKCTDEQKDAFVDAELIGGSDSNIIYVFGDVPTIDIPVILKVSMK